MLPEQQNMIYKHFPELVKSCDLEQIMRSLSCKDTAVTKMMDNVKMEEDRRHNNRCILFQLMKIESSKIFTTFVGCLREHDFEELADRLENKPTIPRPRHITCCVKLPDEVLGETPARSPQFEPLKVDVKYATKFCDSEDYCYRTRSQNRGQVLVINNIVFDTPHRHPIRRGAEVDETNIKDLFENMGLSIEMYRNLTGEEIKHVTQTFSRRKYETHPDIGIVIIMSHGEKIDNKTCIIGSDGKGVEEEWIIRQFSNHAGDLVDDLAHFAQHTQSDAACTKKTDFVEEDHRYYSDMMICHPSVEGFQAHRDTIRGCWYIELICKVFMENSQEVDVESMFKMVERGLKTRISEKLTRQTSTFLNIAFKTCYLNPGIYEEDGVLAKFQKAP